MRETEVHEWVTANLPGVKTRIENAISSGIFDLNIIHKGHEQWVEYKVRDGNLIKVAGTQFTWGLDRLEEGAQNLWFLVMRHGDPEPRLYSGNTILQRCNPAYNDGKRHMLVDLSTVIARGTGRSSIRYQLFGY